MATLQDAAEAIANVGERFDALVARRQGGFSEWKQRAAAQGVEKKNRNVKAAKAIWQGTEDLERETGLTLVKDPAMRGPKTYHTIKSGGQLGR